MWAVDEEHLPNYLVPRDCPRVTFAVGPNTTANDRDWYQAQSTSLRVIAVESKWRERIAAATLYLYKMPERLFSCSDANAGYFIARETVTPTDVTTVSDLIGALSQRDVELRVLPSLWPLYDQVAGSSLEFSIIRMRHAQPRD